MDIGAFVDVAFADAGAGAVVVIVDGGSATKINAINFITK